MFCKMIQLKTILYGVQSFLFSSLEVINKNSYLNFINPSIDVIKLGVDADCLYFFEYGIYNFK